MSGVSHEEDEEWAMNERIQYLRSLCCNCGAAPKPKQQHRYGNICKNDESGETHIDPICKTCYEHQRCCICAGRADKAFYVGTGEGPLGGHWALRKTMKRMAFYYCPEHEEQARALHTCQGAMVNDYLVKLHRKVQEGLAASLSKTRGKTRGKTARGE